MKVILKEAVLGLGDQGDVKEVKNGYANNYLFPRGFALQASDKNMKVFEDYKRSQQKKVKRQQAELDQLAETITSLSCNITVKAGEDDKLFGSVTTADIADALKKQNISLDKRKIILEEPIKQLGVYSVPVHLAPEIEPQLKVWVIKE